MEKSTSTVLRGGDDGNIIPLTRPLRRGDRYGTILVNIETGKPLDLLEDRTAEAVLPWLTNHQEIEIVSRDRASAYADVQMEEESCRFRNKYLPILGSYCEKSGPLDHFT